MKPIKSFFAAVALVVVAVSGMSVPVLADFGVINSTAVTVNGGVIPDGVAVVRAGGSVYDAACSCSKSGIYVKTSFSEDFYQGSFDQVSALKQAKEAYPKYNVVLLDEVGGYDSDGDGLADDR